MRPNPQGGTTRTGPPAAAAAAAMVDPSAAPLPQGLLQQPPPQATLLGNPRMPTTFCARHTAWMRASTTAPALTSTPGWSTLATAGPVAKTTSQDDASRGHS